MNPHARLLLRRVQDDWENLPHRMKPMLAALVVACLHALIVASPVSSALDSMLLRKWFSVRGPREIPRSVTVVRIDEATYARTKIPQGGMLPRGQFATAIDRIAAAGARLIVLDIFFAAEGEDREADQQLARALSASPSVIGYSLSLAIHTDPYGNKNMRMERRLPLRLFRRCAKAVVPMQVNVGDDNVVERISLPPEVVSNMQVNVPLLKVLRRSVSDALREPGQSDYVNFYGEPSSLASISFHDVIDEARLPPAAYFKDRVVFIGVATSAAPGLSGEDSFTTAVSSQPMFGVEIHATIAANLLDGSWIRRSPPWTEGALLGVLAFFGSLLLLCVRWPAGIALALLLPVLWAALSYGSFSYLFRFLPGAMLFLFVLPALAVVRPMFGTSIARRNRWMLAKPSLE